MQWSGLGFVGVPIAMTMQRWLSFIAVVITVIVLRYHKDTWFGWSLKEMFDKEGLRTFWKLGLPGGISVLAEVFG